MLRVNYIFLWWNQNSKLCDYFDKKKDPHHTLLVVFLFGRKFAVIFIPRASVSCSTFCLFVTKNTYSAGTTVGLLNMRFSCRLLVKVLPRLTAKTSLLLACPIFHLGLLQQWRKLWLLKEFWCKPTDANTGTAVMAELQILDVWCVPEASVFGLKTLRILHKL